MVVELWAARMPWVGWIADHHWLVVSRGGAIDRWEVWQNANVGGQSWCYLHRNLLPPAAGVGGGAGRLLRRWSDEVAAVLAERIENAPTRYPWCQRYRVWPGPNSNTFVQWVLGDDHRLGWRAAGARYGRRRLRRVGGGGDGIDG